MDLDDVTQTIDEGLSDGEELETGEIEDGGAPAPEESAEEEEEIGLFDHSTEYPDELNAKIRKANKLFRDRPRLEAELEQVRGDLDAFRRAIEQGRLTFASASEPEEAIPEGSTGDADLDRAIELMESGDPAKAREGTLLVLRGLAEVRKENRELKDGFSKGREYSTEQRMQAGVVGLLGSEGIKLTDSQQKAVVRLYKAGVRDLGKSIGEENLGETKGILKEIKEALSLKPVKKSSPSPSPDTTSGRGAGLKPGSSARRRNLADMEGEDRVKEIMRQWAAG